MARANLQQLLGNVDDPTPAARATPASRAAPREHLGLPSVSPNRNTKTQPVKSMSATTATTLAPKLAPKPAPKPAKFATLSRKETRIRDDQLTGLTALARRLSRAKTTGGERITENTLIRISIDLLLAHEGKLAGEDEVALRRSIGL
jgi:hypothetical protein